MRLVSGDYELVAVDRLVPHPENPRRGDVKAIRASIEANGFVGAILVQRATSRVIAGAHRLLAARESGASEVPVIWADVDDATARRVMLADNRTSDLATYDQAALAAALAAAACDPEAGLAGSGWSDRDLSDLLDRAAKPAADDDTPEASSALQSKWSTSRGQVWSVGVHRVMCGDATSAEDMARLMAGDVADMAWTDPPYNIGYTGKTEEALKIENDSMSDGDFAAFLDAAFGAADAAMRPGAAVYVAHADTEGVNFRQAFRRRWKLSCVLVWVKDSLVMGRGDYHWRHEPILYGWKPGASHHPVADRTQDTVWECDRPKRSTEHPTMKPVALVERAIRNSTHEGEIVLDPFLGSGTTLLACAASGRRCRGMELDPQYLAVILERASAIGLTPSLV
jgi:DNA modification methylase